LQFDLCRIVKDPMLLGVMVSGAPFYLAHGLREPKLRHHFPVAWSRSEAT